MSAKLRLGARYRQAIQWPCQFHRAILPLCKCSLSIQDFSSHPVLSHERHDAGWGACLAQKWVLEKFIGCRSLAGFSD